MGLRERLTQVTQYFKTARTKGRRLMDEDERRASTEDQVSQREDRRLAGMSAEDREWEQASLQRNQDRQA